jgi:hypothetical protein
MNARKTPCPNRDEFEKFFLNKAGFKARERLLDHVRACPSCRVRFEVLLETSREILAREADFAVLASDSLDELAARPAPLRRWTARRFAAAASAALVVGAALLFLLLRAPQAQGPLRGLSAEPRLALSPRGTVQAAPRVLRWKALDGATSYIVEIIDDRLSAVLARTEVRETSLQLPADAFDRLRAGRTYVWSVEAKDDQALTIGAAQAYFEISAPE